MSKTSANPNPRPSPFSLVLDQRSLVLVQRSGRRPRKAGSVTQEALPKRRTGVKRYGPPSSDRQTSAIHQRSIYHRAHPAQDPRCSSSVHITMRRRDVPCGGRGTVNERNGISEEKNTASGGLALELPQLYCGTHRSSFVTLSLTPDCLACRPSIPGVSKLCTQYPPSSERDPSSPIVALHDSPLSLQSDYRSRIPSSTCVHHDAYSSTWPASTPPRSSLSTQTPRSPCSDSSASFIAS